MAGKVERRGRPKKDAPKAETPTTVTLTYEQLQALMSGQAEVLKEFAVELKRPDPEAEAAKALARERLETRRRLRTAEIEAEQESKRRAQENCGHTKENGKSSIYMGQVFSDGNYHPMCHRCNKEFDLVRALPTDYAEAYAND